MSGTSLRTESEASPVSALGCHLGTLIDGFGDRLVPKPAAELPGIRRVVPEGVVCSLISKLPSSHIAVLATDGTGQS